MGFKKAKRSGQRLAVMKVENLITHFDLSSFIGNSARVNKN